MAARRPIGPPGRRTDDDALVEALARNIYGGAPSAAGAPALRPICGRRYVISRAQPPARLAAGELHFPEPADIPVITS